MKFTQGPDIYTIESLQTEPHKDLQTIVAKHQQTVFQKPISSLQAKAFQQAEQLRQGREVILDVGCGTGQSSERLAEYYPDHFVVGVDKSADRLSRNQLYRQGGQQDNLLLLRADVVDFWRLAVKGDWPVVQQALFYPNPYPKPNDFTKRWQGHPVFPSLIQLGKRIEVRSNWRIYLEEFEQAAKQLRDLTGHIKMMTPYQQPMTAFEKKYWDSNVKTYQLVLQGVG